MEKIIIVGVAPPYRGGISLHNALLYKHLSKNFNVLCYNFIRQYPNFLFPGKTQYELNESAVPIKSNRILDSINPFTWYNTANKILDHKPGLVIFRSWNPFFCIMFGIIAKKIKSRSSIKCMVICDNIFPHEKSFFDKYLMSFFLNKMDLFIVQSSIVEKELKSLVCNPKYLRLFHPIYNVFGELQDQTSARKKINVNSKYVILYSGLVRSYKGFDVLIKSVNYLKDQLDDFLVLAIGESYENDKKYRELIKKEGIEDFFIWENRYVPDNEMNQYFSACDVVALPYKSASQSGIIPIAYHFNKPVVVTDVGGLPDMVENHKTGFIIKSNNSKLLANVLAENLKRNRFKNMSQNINEFKKQFSWDNFIKGIISLLKN